LETSSKPQPEIVQTPSPEKDKENEPKRTLLSKSSIKIATKGQISTKMITSSRGTRLRVSAEHQDSQDNVRPFKAVVIRKDFDVSLKEITEKLVQKDSPIHETTFSSEGEQPSVGDKVIEEASEESPYNRSEGSENSFIGKGASEADNRLLA
jgi:hypothetical protein